MITTTTLTAAIYVTYRGKVNMEDLHVSLPREE